VLGVSCASALKSPDKGLNMSPASRIPAAIPIKTDLFIVAKGTLTH
jgi:hypothetical protein